MSRAALRGGLKWTCPPNFFENQFSNSSKFYKEKAGKGGSLFPSQRSRLVSPHSNDHIGFYFLDLFEYSSMVYILNKCEGNLKIDFKFNFFVFSFIV